MIDNKITVEDNDYVSELDNKKHYRRKIWLPQRLIEGDDWIEFKGEPLWFECYFIEEKSRIAHIEFDFGMSKSIYLEPENNFILRNMKDASDEERMAFDVIFDLFHAFHHTSLDPNYSHYHWALYGNLKDRVTIGSNYES